MRLVHVCTPPTPRRFRTEPAPVLAADREHAAAYLQQLATVLAAEWEVQIRTAVLEGPAAETLYADAVAQQASLVVMTTHGHGPLARMWLGGVAQALVRTLPMPVLLTRPHDESVDLLEEVDTQPFTRVLLPLDGSPLAEQVIAHALALGDPTRTQYTLLQAIEPPMLGYAPAAQVAGLDQQILDQWNEIAQEYLAGMAARLRAQGLSVTTQVVFGAAAPAIADYAHAHAIDLIAMATHGRGGAARMLLGSVAERVVHFAGVPVLLFRPDGA